MFGKLLKHAQSAWRTCSLPISLIQNYHFECESEFEIEIEIEAEFELGF